MTTQLHITHNNFIFSEPSFKKKRQHAVFERRQDKFASPTLRVFLRNYNLRGGRQIAWAYRRCINCYIQLSPLWTAVMMALEGEY